MELLEQVRIATIPAWTKLLIGVFLALLMGVTGYVGFEGLFGESKEEWVESGAFLLGTLLPISLLALIAWVSKTGISALHKQTTSILTKVLPDVLQHLTDYPTDQYVEVSHGRPKLIDHVRSIISPTRSARTERQVGLRLHHQPGRCDADYIMTFLEKNLGGQSLNAPALRELYFRVELNVRRVNINFYVPKDRCTARVSSEKPLEIIEALFPHSLGGARGGGQANNYAYQLNPLVNEQTINGKVFYRVVMFCSVGDDLLYSPKEQLFFCQDFMFMTKSFVKEGIEMFDVVPATDDRSTIFRD